MAKRVAASSRKAHNLVRRRLEHSRQYWEPHNFMYGRLLSLCLDLEHYRRSDGLTKDRTRIQPKTQRQFNLIRHKASLLLRQAPQFDTHATQPGADAGAAEVSRRIVEQFFNDPIKGYHDPRSRMVWSALAGGRGCLSFDWHEKWGVCARFVDPRRLHITPGHTFLHDPLNPCTIEEVPMRLSAVRRMSKWNVPDDLTGDGGPQDQYGSSYDREADGIERDQGQHLPGVDEDSAEDPIVTVAKAWFREDPFSEKRSPRAAAADLPDSEWFFIDDQTQLRLPFDSLNPVPPVSPETGQPMRLVTSAREMNQFDKYPEGYLIITAPGYGGESPLFEGTWLDGALNPEASLAAYPYLELVGYRHPLRRTGISDTELTHSLTIVDNSTFRSTYEQMSTAGGILTAQKGKLEDSEGKPFRITSDPINIAWTTDPLGASGLNFFQAMGMNPAMPAFRNMIEAQWQHIGTGDMSSSLGPERSKDIAVGTVNLLQQSGDLPVQLHGQDLALQEAIGARVVLDLCSAYMGDNVVSWVTDEGEVAYATVRGSDLVPLNVTVRADKEWRQQDADRAQATAQMLGMLGKMGLPPQVVSILLRESGVVSPAVAASLAEAMMASPAQPGSGPQGAVPGGSQPPPQAGGPPPLSVVEGMGTQ